METLPKISVLVVEDEVLIAENLRLSLEDLGDGVPATLPKHKPRWPQLLAHPTWCC